MEAPTTQQQQQLPTEQQSYLDAQRAAVEAVEIGRGTLEATDRQGEQLKNASRLADQTQYALDQSSRMIRGMTWSGWVQNIFTLDVRAPSSSAIPGKPIPVEDVPPFAKTAAQAIQNYRANLTVLTACETMEQRNTCHIICQNMFDAAAVQVDQLQVDDNPTVVQQLSHELSKLHQHQKEVIQRQFKQQQQQQLKTTTATASSSILTKTPASQQQQRQDDHLDFLATNLGELHMIANSLNEQVSQHNQMMTTLEDQTDMVHEKTKTVTRKVERMTQKKSWVPPKKVFEKWISIKHIESGKYLSSELNGKLVLVGAFHPEKCVYGVWMRKSGTLFGLKNKFSNRFLGQTMLGSLSCSASNFGQREEWQADDGNWEASRLLIASAGWGNGGYLKIRLRDNAVQIVDKQKADTWCLAEVQSDLR
mmetsp:Transcript_4058/g.6788  ORF Transcript_4058/g.6788 Transcript_4058/m.6788 type:complete len:421 (-) Transcript_4058:63-1325(-)